MRDVELIIGGNPGVRQINYDYDLVSGKVNKVIYQPGKSDQFIYKYEYDADNRLINAYSSRNGLQWQQDAKYYYYLHGPLARTEIGKYKVQGVDYAYTLQGWMKGINSQTLDVTKDIGGDGDPNSPTFQKFGRDVYGYTLGYHGNDYKPIGGTTANAFDLVFTPPSTPVGTTGNTGSQLYNGNISYTTVALNMINNAQTTGYSYLYDQLNRILAMRQHSISGTIWDYGSYNSAYEERVSYDANGNIKKYLRKGANITGMPLGMDSLKYFYYYTTMTNVQSEYDPTQPLPNNVKFLSNRLAHVHDSIPSSNYTVDTDDQNSANYDYDNIGNLIKDNSEGITSINWTVYGKIKQIVKNNGVTINYGYDVVGNRVIKEVIGAPGGYNRQFYIRDPQGNVLAIYKDQTDYVDWTEQHLYGSTRLGIWNYGKSLPAVPGSVSYDSMMVGSFNYELSNHLGNVITIISDKKIGVSAGGISVDYYRSVVVNQNDYFPFGMMMPGRIYEVAVSYRYGFNGKENDNEVKGEGNQQDYGMRIYDPRLGRFLSVDPITIKYPELTPYQFASNRPIDGIDLDGLEFLPVAEKNKYGEKQVWEKETLIGSEYIKYTSRMDKVIPAGQPVTQNMTDIEVYRMAFNRYAEPGKHLIASDQYIDERLMKAERQIKYFYTHNVPGWSASTSATRVIHATITAGLFYNDESIAQGSVDQIKLVDNWDYNISWVTVTLAAMPFAVYENVTASLSKLARVMNRSAKLLQKGFQAGWPTGNIAGTIETLVGRDFSKIGVEVTETGKVIWSNEETGFKVVQDPLNKYFRVQNAKGEYVGLNGKPIKIPKGVKGKDASNYFEQNTHFNY